MTAISYHLVGNIYHPVGVLVAGIMAIINGNYGWAVYRHLVVAQYISKTN